MIIMVNDEKHS